MQRALIQAARSPMGTRALQNLRMSAVRRIQGAGRSYLHRKRSKAGKYVRGRSKRRNVGMQQRLAIGTRVGSSVSKCDQIEDSFAQGTKTLRQYKLLDLAKSNDLSDTQSRNRDLVNFRGIKLCINFQNVTNSVDAYYGRIMHGHVAVVSPRALDATTDVPFGDFFRSQGEVGKRGKDFAIDLTGLDFRCLPINTDLYYIHQHYKFKLARSSTTSGGTEMLYEKYLPLKRQIRYENQGSTPEGKNMYLLMWYSFVGEPGGSTPAGTINCEMRVTRFFKESFD